MNQYSFSPFDHTRFSPEEQRDRLSAFGGALRRRRSIRAFSPDPVPRDVIEAAIHIAGTAPSGANQQPWHFVIVEDPNIKRQIREAAEEEEHRNYHGRMPDDWLEKLAPLGTDEHKPFLEIAPYLIVVFKIDYGIETDASGAEVKIKHYYVNESVGLASGFLLAALQMAGLATLTHTPSPMGFLSKVLGVPKNYKPFLLIPVGFPSPDAEVPDIKKKPLSDIMTVR